VIAVDLHVHTCHSPDSDTPLSGIVQACSKAGIDCVAITDHNCIDGALELQRSGGVRVIVGEEIRTTAGELLGLFLSECVPPGLDPIDAVARVKAQGGLVCMPHPFSRWPVARPSSLGCRNGETFVPDDRLRSINSLLTQDVLETVDMIEVMNSRTPFSSNLAAARRLAELCGVPGTAGSDAHTAREVGRARIEMPDFSDAASFLAAMRDARALGVKSSFFVHFSSTWVKLRRKTC
jgi:predicted metal-dependent phosphoesterase TrpH